MNTNVAAVLIDIEAQLRQMNLWDKIPPSSQALASPEPFCVDTLTLPQWLQFVFIPTIYELLETGQALPQACSITPMAEEFFQRQGQPVEDLLGLLRKIDDMLSAPEQAQD